MANGDVFRVTLEGAYVTEAIAVQHVLWFRQTSASPVADEDAVLLDDVGENVLAGAVGATLKSVQSAGFQWLGVRAQKMLDPLQEPVFAAADGVLVGTGQDVVIGAGAIRIPSVCCLVAKITSERLGRSGLGRLYLGGFATISSAATGSVPVTRDHGRWSADCVSHVQTFLNNLRARYDGVTVLDVGSGMQAELGVWSRKFGGNTPPYNPAGFSPVIGALAQEEIRIQRRREFAVGL